MRLRSPGALAFTLSLCCLSATSAFAQERRTTVFGTFGAASIGSNDSKQGDAPLVGGGVSFQWKRWLAADGDVHGARVRNVFGRADHTFREITLTGSLLFRRAVTRRVQLLTGGGIAVQRVDSEFPVAPSGRIDQSQTLDLLLHGRVGAEWGVSDRVVLRTEGVLWFGNGLDWILGARAGLGYRF